MIDLFIDDNKNKEPEKEKTSLVKGKYMSLNVGAQEKVMIKTLEEYNKLCDSFYPDIIGWNYPDLYKHSKDKELTITDWKLFILDSRVRTWINDEIYLINKTKQVELLNRVGTDHSTATVQALTSLMKANEDEDNRIDDSKIFIYSFMPLTDQERRLNNVNYLRAIPDEVKDAIQYIPGRSNKI